MSVEDRLRRWLWKRHLRSLPSPILQRCSTCRRITFGATPELAREAHDMMGRVNDGHPSCG